MKKYSINDSARLNTKEKKLAFLMFMLTEHASYVDIDAVTFDAHNDGDFDWFVQEYQKESKRKSSSLFKQIVTVFVFILFSASMQAQPSIYGKTIVSIGYDIDPETASQYCTGAKVYDCLWLIDQREHTISLKGMNGGFSWSEPFTSIELKTTRIGMQPVLKYYVFSESGRYEIEKGIESFFVIYTPDMGSTHHINFYSE